MKTHKKLFLLAVIIASTLSLNAQTYTWKSVNLQGMGYVTGIIGHPTGGQVYARTDVYGIYKWDNTNSKWIPLTENKIAKPNIESFAIDPSNANNIYIIGGNNENGSLYKSTDQGLTWTELTNFNTKGINVQGNGSWRGAGERIAVDPNNGGKTLFCGTRSNGLWKSTDSGATWTQIPTTNVSIGTNGGIVFVIFDPSSGTTTTNSQKIYVGVQGQGVYYTTTGGTSWAKFTGGPATTSFPIRAAISNAGILYVTYASSETGGGTGFVYKYTGTGTALANVTPTTKAAEGFWGIGVDPANGNNVSTFQSNIANGNTIHYSASGGSSWSPKTCAEPTTRSEPGWYPSWAGWTWSAAMLMDPSNYKKVWLTTGFAIYNTPDISVAAPLWTARMTNFEELVVKHVICPPVTGGANLLAGFADKQGVRVINKDVLPTATFEVDAFGITTDLDYCVADPNFIVTVGGDQNNGPDWESANQKYRYSTNNGVSWTNFTRPTTTSVNGNIAVSCTDKNRWVIAPKDRSATMNEPYYTTNAGTSWTVTNGTPLNKENGCTEQWSGSKFLTSDKVNGMTFYYYADRTSTSSAGFYASTDGGATFVLKNSGLPASFRSYITSVPGKEGHVFYVNKQGGSLYLTTNGGTTFSTITGVSNCKAIGIGKAIAPSVEPTLFIAGTVGGVNSIYQSTNYGTSWTNISDNNIPINNVGSITGDLRTEGLVYLSTGGRGVIYGTAPAVATIPVTSVSVSPTSASLSVGGSTQQITATVLPANATNLSVSWSSTDNNIATVSTSGLVTPVGPGIVTIKATSAADNTKSASATITVTSSTFTSSLQAEDATTKQGTFGNTNLNFTGTGYVNVANTAAPANGQYIEWANASSPTAQSVTLNIFYANNDVVSRACDVFLNGTLLGNYPFTKTTDWSTWTTQQVTVSLTAGVNIIKIATNNANSGKGPNIDKIEFVSNPSTSLKTGLLNSDMKWIISENQLIINEVSNSKINIYNIAGQQISSKNTTKMDTEIAFDLTNLAQGVYIVKVYTNADSKQFKFIRQ